MKVSRKNPNTIGAKKLKTRDQSISISYDHEADALSLIFDKSTKAEADEIGPGVYARPLCLANGTIGGSVHRRLFAKVS